MRQESRRLRRGTKPGNFFAPFSFIFRIIVASWSSDPIDFLAEFAVGACWKMKLRHPLQTNQFLDQAIRFTSPTDFLSL